MEEAISGLSREKIITVEQAKKINDWLKGNIALKTKEHFQSVPLFVAV